MKGGISLHITAHVNEKNQHALIVLITPQEGNEEIDEDTRKILLEEGRIHVFSSSPVSIHGQSPNKTIYVYKENKRILHSSIFLIEGEDKEEVRAKVVLLVKDKRITVQDVRLRKEQ